MPDPMFHHHREQRQIDAIATHVRCLTCARPALIIAIAIKRPTTRIDVPFVLAEALCTRCGYQTIHFTNAVPDAIDIVPEKEVAHAAA